LTLVGPKSVHLTAPRNLRSRKSLPNTKIHTVQDILRPSVITYIDGLPVTTVERTIIDCANGDTQPDQIELACNEAMNQGMTSPQQLLEAAQSHGDKTQKLINQIVENYVT